MTVIHVRRHTARGRLSVSFPYNPGLVELVKRLPSRQWDKANKLWIISEDDLSELRRLSASYQLDIDLTPNSPPRNDAVERDALIQHFNGKLFEFQSEGVNFLLSRRNCILGWEMGLGKTVATIASLELLRSRNGVRNALILCPKSVLYQWKQEIEKFTQDKANVIEGPRPDKSKLILESSSFLFSLTNYETIRTNPADFKQRAYDCVVLDEAQRIGNHKAQTTRLIKELFSSAAYKWALTGTPLMNRLSELYSIMSYVDPFVLGSWREFSEKYLIYDDVYSSSLHEEISVAVGTKNLDQLNTILSGNSMLRKRKEDVLDELPPLVFETRFVTFLPAERTVYSKVYDNYQRSYTGDESTDAVFAMLLRLRRLCDSISIERAHLAHMELPDEEFAHASSKSEELMSIITDAEEDSKFIIFTEWEDTLNEIVNCLAASKIECVSFKGSMDSRSREHALESFRSNPKIRCFVSTDAGQYGLNLQSAHYVINYDLPWNPARLLQRVGRAHRIGQARGVTCINLIHRGTVEDIVVRKLHEKAGMIGAVIEGIQMPQSVDEKPSSSNRLHELAQVLFRTAKDLAKGEGQEEHETREGARIDT